MALVRCPKHKIPYNDSNPRGCPACAQEKDGGAASVMQELARASQKRQSGMVTLDTGVPVTSQPRLPVPTVTRLMQVLAVLRTRRNMAIGAGVIALLLVALVLTTQARFVAAESPATYNGVVRPFPVVPNDPIGMVFSALGPQSAQPNPTARTLERYSYGTDLFVDAMNGLVYAVTIAVPNRSWRGLRVGMNQTNAEGTLAIMGTLKNGEPPFSPKADTVGGYTVYRTLDLRPRKTLLAEVRPPNACYDVLVDLQPRSIGVVSRGGQKWYAVAATDASHEWVVTRIRVISRSINGPYSAAAVC